MPPQRRKKGKAIPSCQGNEDGSSSLFTQCKEVTSHPKGLQNKKKSTEDLKNSPRGKKRKGDGANDSQSLDGKGGENRVRRVYETSHHIAHYLRNLSQGSRPCSWQNLALNAHVVSQVKELQAYRDCAHFDRRVTALAWNPRSHNTMTLGTKSGNVFVWKVEQQSFPSQTISGSGANGSIQALKFSKNNPDQLFTASINGTVCRYTDYRNQEILLCSNSCDHWYTSLDVCVDHQALMTGDNKGWVTLLTPDDQITWKLRLHSAKVTHIEFSPRDSNCLVTASVDRMLKVWDLRHIKSSKTFLYSDSHEKPINSAYFSCTDGNRLLTTDQDRELRIYTFPSFNLTHKLLHPHRHFQHLTPIKAVWHPLRDLIAVGRYPDPSFPRSEADELRTIDFFDGDSGQLLYQHFPEYTGNKIISLNLFSPNGEYMLSAAGRILWLWKQSSDDEEWLWEFK